MAKIGRPGAAKGKKKPTVGTGGHSRKGLEGKGPTPKAEERPYHKAYKLKQKAEAANARPGRPARAADGGPAKDAAGKARGVRKGEFVAGRAGMGARAITGEVLNGRNSVLEALKAKVPATALFVATRLEMDDRVREAIAIANNRGIPISEVTRPEIDRMTGGDSVHQGVALQVPPYNYKHPLELLEEIQGKQQVPLLVALDGITDPRNLGAIIRSVAAFGGQGVILPQRRSVGVTAAAWKTSAGAAARTPVALAGNLNQTIKEYKQRGLFVLGLDGDGDISLPELELANEPLLIVVGSEGKGLSRLVQENCDAIVSIPISTVTESLNAGIAASVALYQIAALRSRQA